MFLVAIVCLLLLALVQAHPLDNGRSLSWSGWTPGNGMSLFTSSDDPWGSQESLWGARGTAPWGGQAVSPWGGRQLSPSLWGHHQSSPSHWGRQGDASPLWRRQTGETTAASHPAAPSPEPNRDQFDELEHEQQHARPSRPHYGSSKEDDEEDERKSPGSNANASFNAWFPILLGRYPGGEERTRGGGSSEEGPNNERGLAAIANSVNHGRSGAASSHAVIYSGLPPPPLTSRSRQRKSQEASYY